MLRDAAITLLEGRLGNRTNLRATIILEMQQAQQTALERNGIFYPWFLEIETLTTIGTTTKDIEFLALPADWLAEIEEQSMWIFDSGADEPYVELKKGAYDVALQRFPEAAQPKRYMLNKNNILFKPTPDKGYVIQTRYFATDQVLSTNSENDWLKYASDWLIAETGIIIARDHIQNDPMAQRFIAAATRARDRVFIENEARQHVGRVYSMRED